MKKLGRKIGLVILVLLGLLGIIQLVPYGRQHTNPPVLSEPQWDSSDTRILAQRACFDCHSNEVIWPWYSSIAPGSWLIQHDVEEGRSKLNFSEWQQGGNENFDEIQEVLMAGEMPPIQYLLLHPVARLTEAEKKQFLQGLQNSIGAGR
ncbi:MAG TPA: heme-binding domain-containing protein [Anaerolineaceae bacterium]|nr:heme-binding domain-containing protein [Anaerolineaceae bacterium]